MIAWLIALGAGVLCVLLVYLAYRRSNALGEASKFLKERRFDRSFKDPWN